MVATLAQAASAAYYLESQRSFRHPNEYYTAGEEPDGVWFNPSGLFGLEDGGKVDSGAFHKLYHGFAPDGSGKLTRNAGSEKRSPGLDMTFSADKSVSALWAVADHDLRARIEEAHNDAARTALEETVFRYCGWTRIRTREGRIEALPADIGAAMFQHGTSRDNDPQLHTHCVIFNAARTREDGKWRAMHQHPVYGWMKAAGAVYRNALAWNLHERLCLPVEQYGREGEFTRIVGVPEDLAAHWSKRRAAIVDAAGDMGFRVEGNAARAAAANKVTRAGKSPDNDPEVRHRRWRAEAEGFVEREALVESLLGTAQAVNQERIRALTEVLEDLPERLTREEAVFRLPDIVERVSNATAGLLSREAVTTSIGRVVHSPQVVRLTRIPRSAEGRADMAHTRLYTTGRTLEMEQALRELAAGMAAETGHGLAAGEIERKIASLMEQGYPLSREQAEAIRAVAGAPGRVAIVEGAAGSGKTTTLRPIADLCREDGKTVVATAVAWRTAVALGNDVDARPFCVDKLLKLAARGELEIDRNTVVIVDEAGMLSTRQAHHILRLAERHGAKVVFAGDTRQQQPVEAGPGLRLIRDAVGSVRVDRIRRQKADLEDILVHVHGEAPAAARLSARSMADAERARIVSDYEAMEEKPAFTPWQVAAAEALRDGDAAAAIQAHHERGRFHLCFNEERTLNALVDDWERYTAQHPEKSSVVLARTHAEARALSHLMRERRMDRRSGDDGLSIERVTVTVSRGTEDDRTASPLEITVGDRLRIGATHWEKQLFNGTMVTVENFEVLSRERGPAPREAGGRARDRDIGEDEPSVLIAARTDDGRKVSFRHDEIRDWYGNIRLDHGYALTVAAAQGLTVDCTFLLADDRPARETVYPAATRHREALDIYVNRAPLAMDVAERRADSDREAPVLDSEVRAYLAERWSRSRPKEAALDYMAAGDREEHEERRERRRAAARNPEETTEARTVPEGGAFARIAQEAARTAFAWRHGRRVDAFAAGRREVMASWDALRERTRAEGDAVALGDDYRKTLDRHAALLKQARPFRTRPEAFSALLARRAGIGRSELDAFEALHDRARRHRRSAVARQAHRMRREADRRDHEPDTAPDTRRRAGVEPSVPGWRPEWEAVAGEWNALLEAARRAGIPAFYAEGYDNLVPRIRALAENPDIPAERRAPMAGVLENHERHLGVRQRISGWLERAEGHLDAHAGLRRAARDRKVEIAETGDYRGWRRTSEELMKTGRAMLSDGRTYGPHLDRMHLAASRIEWALADISETIRRDDDALRRAAALGEAYRAAPREPDPAEAAGQRARQAGEDAREYSRLQSAVYNARDGEEREAARKAFDEYRKREAHKYEDAGEERRRARTRKRSMRRTMRP